MSFLGFPQDIAYFRLDVNNTDGMTSTDLSVSEKEIVLRDKENAPCKSYDDQLKESISMGSYVIHFLPNEFVPF